MDVKSSGIYDRNIAAIAEELRFGRERQHRATLLVGAGCSVAAGIPLAAGFVELIRAHFPDAYDRAENKSYACCMAELHRGFRHKLIAEQVDAAKINWAHVAIAQLMREGYVDRVLTTNFDPLVLRACALMGDHPAVYDFAVSQLLKPEQVANKAVFHLHGQRAGFVLLNTKEECEAHAGRLGPLFEHAGRGRTWIVVGYSGENDPVFQLLSKVPEFEYGLYWVGFKDKDPARHVRNGLFTESKGAYFVRGYDADEFFVELARKLDCFPPIFVQRPFSFLKVALDSLAHFSLRGAEPTHDVLRAPKEIIEQAIVRFEQEQFSSEHTDAGDGALEQGFLSMLMAGRYQALQEFARHLRELPEPLQDPLRWSYILDGDQLLQQARQSEASEADGLFQLAGEKYQGALDIKPDDDDALNNWGNALAYQAGTKSGDEADRLFRLAGEKYQAALDIKPDEHDVLYNWGSALADQARTKSGEETDRLFRLAAEKYQAALDIKPDEHDPLNNWGSAVAAQAATKSGEEADQLFRLAAEKYQAALDIKPDMHEAFYNWGSMLMRQASMKSGGERLSLLDLAVEKLSEALAYGSKDALYNLACAAALQGNQESAERHLVEAWAHNALPGRAHVKADPDFAGMCNEPWFTDFLASLDQAPGDEAA